MAGAPTDLNMPKLVGFNFIGGLTLSPEFIALLLGLVLYTSAFVAEVVRAGIQSVSKGQTEAAMSLGLRPPGAQPCDSTPGPSGHHSAAHQPDAEPDQKQLAGGGHRVS